MRKKRMQSEAAEQPGDVAVVDADRTWNDLVGQLCAEKPPALSGADVTRLRRRGVERGRVVHGDGARAEIRMQDLGHQPIVREPEPRLRGNRASEALQPGGRSG